MRKIDIFNHIWPQPFFDALIRHIGTMTDMTRRSGEVPMMTDLDRRFEVMDMFGAEYQQILSLASPPLEKFAGPDGALNSRVSARMPWRNSARSIPIVFPPSLALRR